MQVWADTCYPWKVGRGCAVVSGILTEQLLVDSRTAHRRKTHRHREERIAESLEPTLQSCKSKRWSGEAHGSTVTEVVEMLEDAELYLQRQIVKR